MDLCGRWIDMVHRRKPIHEIILDLDSSVSETYGRQEGSAYNGHFGCTCYHPLFCFNQFGDLERYLLRNGNVASADDWRSVLAPILARYRGLDIRRLFRGDAAFARPEVYEDLEEERYLYAIRLPANAVLYRVVAEDGLSTTETDKLVGSLMDTEPPAGYASHVGGEAAFSYDFTKEIDTWFPWVIVWVVFTSLIVFALLLRSVALPVLAVVVNLATLAMSLGILVLIFQGDTFENVFRFTATGAIDAIERVLMVCVLFGITMDYAVFMLTRMHERWLRTGDSRESVEVGLVRTGRIIVSAALLVVIVTGAFAFTSISTTKVVGVGIALAIIADTVLVRLVLLPSVMVYLGRASWWWPYLKKRHTRKLEEP